MKRLSHTSYTKYKECGKKYFFHYKENLRPKQVGSALVFGNAMDVALNEMLRQHQMEKIDLESCNEVFEEAWRHQIINGVMQNLTTCGLIKYSKADLDMQIFTSEDFQLMDEYDHSWISLRRKGLLFLKAYAAQVLPRIKSTKAIQKEIGLANEEGDTIVGFVDFIAEWDDGVIRVCDNKTSSRPYEDSAIAESTQLPLYCAAEQMNEAAYVVLIKNIKKKKTCVECGYVGLGRHELCNNVVKEERCGGEWKLTPDVQIQIQHGKVTQEACDKVLDDFLVTSVAIDKNKFERNFESCYAYGQECPYFAICRGGESSDARLEKVMRNVEKIS